ncbi:MAG TPA: hypothetical protein VK574_21195 [Terracidiphilus sp.]|nr:hypothetical protein [Terracidiphilus sp.]
MRNWLSMGLQLPLLMVLNNGAYAQNEHPVAAPDSIILSGREYGGRLFVTTPAGSFPVQGPFLDWVPAT